MKYKGIGLLLVLIGLLILLGNLGLIDGDYVLIVIGVVFMGIYWFSGKDAPNRNIGFLIPSTILIMIGLYDLMEGLWRRLDIQGIGFFISIGIAFVLIYLIHTSQLKAPKKGTRYWPLYVSSALFGFSIFIIIITNIDSQVVWTITNNIFPIALIIVGGLMIYKSISKKKVEQGQKENNDQ